MTFFEWMNDKYPDPDSACGELTLCLRNIDALQDCGCLCRFYPASSAAFHAAQNDPHVQCLLVPVLR